MTSVQVNENCELKDSIILLISMQIILFFYQTVCERSASSERGEAKAC